MERSPITVPCFRQLPSEYPLPLPQSTMFSPDPWLSEMLLHRQMLAEDFCPFTVCKAIQRG